MGTTKHKSEAKKTSQSNRSSTIMVAVIICVTLVVLSTLLAWYLVERDKTNQKDRELIKKEQMLHYEQEQLNKREELRTGCSGDNPYQKLGLGC